MEYIKLSIIIPAYNESKRLPATLNDINNYLSDKNYSYELLVVNDGSTDDTAGVVDALMPSIQNLKLINLLSNQGKGVAVRLGMTSARGDLRLFMDADNSTSIKEFDKMLSYIRAGHDVVMGSRAVKGAKMNPPQVFYKRIAGRLGNFFIRFLFFINFKDTQCGFKCFTAEAANKIFTISKINRWGFDIEAVALADAFGYKIKEIPVYWVNNPDSRVRLSSYFQVLWEAVKVRWWLWRGAYKLKNPTHV